MKPANIFLAICIAAGIAFLSGLGFWQLNRLAWKEGMIDRVERNLSGQPMTIEQVEDFRRDGKDFEYRPVVVSGVFDHANSSDLITRAEQR